jgi:hypothetical protein
MVLIQNENITLEVDDFYKKFQNYIDTRSNNNSPTELLDEPQYLANQYRLTELKSIARHYKLTQSGKKQCIAERICAYFHRLKSCMKIQRQFRGHLVRCWMANGFLRRSKMLVNETDGYTLEPLAEIPMQRMICMTERINNHIYYYGFDVVSLIPVIKQTLDNKRAPLNIYTRNEISKKSLSKIILIYYLIRAQYPETFREINNSLGFSERDDIFLQLGKGRRMTTRELRRAAANTVTTLESPITIRQAKTLGVRIDDIFTELHYLGNYVVADWFTNLDIYACITFYEFLFEIWFVRMNITYDLRNRISPFRDPFSNTNVNNRWVHCNTPSDVLRICVETMEYMVMDGVDEDSRKLGGMYVLTALTLVSREARVAFPWLYEGIV